MLRSTYFVLLLCAATACDAEPEPADDAGSTVDGGQPRDGSAGRDAAGDASGPCTSDGDCSDGEFCNGAERCDPDAADADADGCAPPSAEACMPDQSCDEDDDRCLTECDVNPDADGDGHDSVECAGDDCDDADPDRFPGNTEICDEDDHDEDCDPETFGERDLDDDGAFDAACCNVREDETLACGTDCDDASAQAAPGQVEACDLVDNDCDMAVDEGVLTSFWPDTDGDGYGDEDATPSMACSTPANHADNDTDCDDGARLVNPATSEICDGLDNNCDSNVDEAGVRTYYRDVDEDGFGDPGENLETTECTPPTGYVPSANDCDDRNGEVRPGGVEICNGLDDNCSRGIAGGGIDAAEDQDGDERAPLTATCVGGPYSKDDCNDSRADVYEGALELCDRLDNDCSSGGGVDASEDVDGDGFAPTGALCSGGFAKTDCDDDDPDVDPGEVEECDRIDSNCSSGGGTDLAEDADDDGHSPGAAACIGGFPKDDCNDFEATIYGGAPEVCDRLDNNCSSGGGVALAEDVDGDNHAPIGGACEGGPLPEDDCDDGNAAVHPGAVEVCDRLDDDCSSGGGVELSEDGDGDSHAPLGAACTTGFPKSDCDDGDASVNPGATEQCDGIDGNCSSGGGPDVAEDGDGDQFAPPTANCSGGYPRTDCADEDATIHPDAPELCDRLDNDCTGGGGANPIEDADNDGHAPTSGICADGPLPDDDCDDGDALTYLGAPERCDRRDNDCGGGVAHLDEDVDDDGFAALDAVCSGGFSRTDCDDTDPDRNPSATEPCDGIDSDCGLDAEDVDGDGHVAVGHTCSGGALPDDDCDDADESSYPGATELCDRVDNNCSTGGGLDSSEDFDDDGYAPLDAECPGGGFEATDCDDFVSATHPGAAERCDGVDSDCEGDAEDADGDTHAVEGHVCEGGPYLRDDCDDDAAFVYTGASEVCNGIDDDCDDDTDEGTQLVCYADSDGDGYAAVGASTTLRCACTATETSREPAGADVDCVEGDETIHPDAAELCDRVDSDCTNGGGAEPAEDFDDDGVSPFGADCSGGYFRNDCNDMNANVYPGADELCDGLDTDCASGGGTAPSEDADGDGYTRIDHVCIERMDTFQKTDCNDGSAVIYDGAPEPCNGIDNDCSLPGAQAGGADPSEDADGDLHSSPAHGCSASTFSVDDCNDANATVYLGAPELCDRVDNDCSSGGGVVAAEDVDQDTFAPAGTSICSGGPYPRTDCDDGNGTINPDRTEVPGDAADRDENCNNRIACYADADNDDARSATSTTADDRTGTCGAANVAYASAPVDCCEANPAVRPGADYSIEPATNCPDPWDYNCSGSTNYQYTDATAGCSGIYPDCTLNRGWRFGLAACGAREQWVNGCTSSGGAGLCTPTVENRDQGCR